MTQRGRTPLAFGTSGLRGLVSDITDFEAYVNTRGFLDFVTDSRDAAPGSTVALAGDLRPSTHSESRSILRAVAKAVIDAGFRPLFCGRIPTPALASFAFERRWPSVMVTGSHIPFDRNGIKFNKADGEVLKTDEAPILAAVAKRRAAPAEPGADPTFDDDGMFLPGAVPELPEEDGSAREAYVARYLRFFPEWALKGLRICVYEHTAVGRDLLTDVLRKLGAVVFPLGRSESFVAIDTEAISEPRLAEIQSMIDRTRREHGPVDALVSTDGDSDRPLVVAVDRDGKARFISGDVLGILVADYLRADAIGVPITSSDAIDSFFSDPGVLRIRTKVGSPWLIAAMAGVPGRRRVGWEANGGFLTFSPIERSGRTLAPLPTRDALLPILACLHAAAEKQSSVGGLLALLPQRFTRAGLLDNVPVEETARLMRALHPANDAVTSALFSAGKVTAWDATETELVLAPSDVLELSGIERSLARHFDEARGFSPIARLNFLDGVRIGFENGDVAHIRPSGNAPQLRIYAQASAEARAKAIVDDAIADPSGLLRALLADTGAKAF